MKAEMDIVRADIVADAKEPTTATRRALREATDAIIHDALLTNELPSLLQMSAECMIVVAGCMVSYEQDPGVPDFVEGAQACIECARAVIDKGLMLNSWETVRCGAVMLELTCRGIFAALGAPYDQVLAECYRARKAGENPGIRALLTEHGLMKNGSENDC